MYYSIREGNILLGSLFSVIQMFSQLCENKVINVQRKTQYYQFCDFFFFTFLASSARIESKS